MAITARIRSIAKLGVVCWCAAGCAASTISGPERFSSAERAVGRLEEAIADRNSQDAERILGPEGDFLLHSGDETLDQQRAREFVRAFNERHVLDRKDDRTYVLQIGKNGWPFPVPIVKQGDDWFFDAAAGRDEILARRIGENELRVMAVCRAVAEAQRIYASKDRSGDRAKKYAAKLVSSPGKHDGLYWPAGEGEELSPLGVLVAEAAEEGYTPSANGEPKPYQGYLFRIFAQRPSASHPRGSYWLVAYPVLPDETGVMLFAANERGWIYEKPSPQDFAQTIIGAAAFKVDSSWTRVE